MSSTSYRSSASFGKRQEYIAVAELLTGSCRPSIFAWTDTACGELACASQWMEFHNQKRPHSTLVGKPPAVVYWQRIETANPDQQERRAA